jgi:hypothetical protein
MKKVKLTEAQKQAAMFLLFEHDWDKPMYRGDAIGYLGCRLHALCGGTEKQMEKMSADARGVWYWLGEKIVRKLQRTGWLYCDKRDADYLRRPEGAEETPMFEEWRNMTRG